MPPEWVLSAVKRHVFLLLTGLFVLLHRWRIMGSAPPTFQIHDNPHSFVNGTALRVSLLVPKQPAYSKIMNAYRSFMLTYFVGVLKQEFKYLQI